MTIDRSAVC